MSCLETKKETTKKDIKTFVKEKIWFIKKDWKSKKSKTPPEIFDNDLLKYDVEEVDISYGFTKRIIKDLSFQVNKGDFLSILGPNGAGKSTLIKTLCRIQNPSKGMVLFEGKLVHKDNLFTFYPRLIGLQLKKIFSFNINQQKIKTKINLLEQKVAHIKSNANYQLTNVLEKLQVAIAFNKKKKEEWLTYYKDFDIKKLEKKISKIQDLLHIDEIIKRKHEYYKKNRHVKAFSSNALAKRLAYVPQILDFPKNIKVYDFVKLGRFPHQKLGLTNQKTEDEIIMRALETVEMTEFSGVYLEDLSGGQQQRCLIAMALAQDTDTIVLDEPTNHLDIKSQLEIVNLLHVLNRDLKKTIILVIHDLNYSIRYANKLLVLKNGMKVDFGDAQKVMTPKLIKEVFGVNSKINLDSRNRKYIEYSWLDQQESHFINEKNMTDLTSLLGSSPVIDYDTNKKIQEIEFSLLK